MGTILTPVFDKKIAWFIKGVSFNIYIVIYMLYNIYDFILDKIINHLIMITPVD